MKVPSWITESNRIEDIYDDVEDRVSTKAWDLFQKEDKLTFDVILHLHRHIMKKQRHDIAGKLRNVNVRVGGYVCPDWSQVGSMLVMWVKNYAEAKEKEKIIKAHIDFESIHPFEDGNGRTGRMIMNWQFVQAGQEPLLIREREKHRYYAWFNKENRLEDVIERFL